MTATPPDPILDLDACALSAATTRGDLTCSEVTRAYLTRLQALNGQLRAVITVNPSAQADAEALDQLPLGERRSMHGVPVLIKDNIDVAGLPTTAGSILLKDHIPAEDAPLVARLRAAGAVILGKANMTEWANFMTLGMSNGYSSLGGQTVNPWGPEVDTGGSSSGSGVAVAARLCAAAIGTETSGSIVSPAHQSGVIGLKPTVGLVPRTGIIPISHSQDTAGPITRSVRDAALLLNVMAGPDAQDPASRNLPVPDLSLTEGALKGASIGVIRDETGVSPADQQAQSAAEEAMIRAGATLVPVDFPSRAEMQASGWMLDVLVYEFKHDLNAYLAGVTNGPRSLSEVIEANDADPERCLRYGQHLLYAAQGTRGDLSEQGYLRARERDLRLTRTGGFDQLFARGLDAVLFPGIQGCSQAAKAGYPSLSVPHVGTGAPGGVLLVAPAGQDGRLMSLGAHLNRELGGVRLPPI
ncbi:amidase family protein [Deinococcus deserti]|uniref:Putative amidase n=1 Tax=Deinococcus deserti (strain DSM 17065 / CIP 109153 / LMG 22923 / VCD115) TaxID=546414 RepID=C1CUZ8_DEIDV|nr:amidase family protein [Deinococcus deserti]ACO46015.1 putative amidase [Deinococcus deserti VCD115]